MMGQPRRRKLGREGMTDVGMAKDMRQHERRRTVAREGAAQHRRHGEVDLERNLLDRHHGQRHRDGRGHLAAQGCGEGIAAAHHADPVERGVHQQGLRIAQPVGRQGPPPRERGGVFRIERPGPVDRPGGPVGPIGGIGRPRPAPRPA